MSFDDRIQATLDRALAAAREQLMTDVRAAMDELSRTAAAEREDAVERAVTATIDDLRRSNEAELQAVRDAAERQANELRESTDTQIADARRAQHDAEAAAEQGRAAVRVAEEARETAEGRMAEAHGRMAEAQREAAEAAEARDAAEQRLTAAHDTAEDARRSAEQRLAEARQQAEDAIARALANAAMERERDLAELEARTRADHDRTALTETSRLAESLRALDTARSLSAVLDALAERSAAEAGRAAVLLVRGERLVGWRFMGFSNVTGAPRHTDMTLDEAGVAGAAVRSAAAQTSGANGVLPPFAGENAAPAVALPLVVGGSVVAVVYAQSSESGTPVDAARWPSAVEMLVRHAGRVLEAVTVQKAAGLSPAAGMAGLPWLAGVRPADSANISITGSAQ